MEQIKMKTCGATDIGGYPIRQMVCDRESGHDGWHNESETGSSWPPKCPLCHDTGMVRNDQSPQGWDDCIRCEAKLSNGELSDAAPKISKP